MLESTLPAAAEDPVFTMHRGGQFDERVAPAVAAQARTDRTSRR